MDIFKVFKTYHKILFPLIISQFISCNSYQYVSSPAFVPLNEEKGELKSYISFNSLQAGYSLTQNVGIFSDINFRARSYPKSWIRFNFGSETPKEGYHNVNDYNIGLMTFGKDGKFIYELLVAGGIGKMSFIDSNNTFSLKTDKSNLYIQPIIGYNHSDNRYYVSFALYSKIYYTHYTITLAKILDVDEYKLNPDYDNFIGKKDMSSLYFEPGLLFRAGLKHISFQVSFSPTISLKSNDPIKYRPLNMFFGVYLNFGLLRDTNN